MKRPTSKQANSSRGISLLREQLSGASAAGEDKAIDQPLESLVERATKQFESSLADAPELDEDARTELGARFRAAAEEQMVSGRLQVDLPGRSDWLDAVEALRKSGTVSDEDSHALVRELEEAMRPLQSREAQSAIEFARRLTEDGETAALEWLRDQRAAQPAAGVEEPIVSRDRPNRDAVVKSKSRRLRGPPVG